MKKKPLTERPNPKRPQLWMGTDYLQIVERFRILYPDGRTGWHLSGSIACCDEWGDSKDWDKEKDGEPSTPCWQPRKRMPLRERIKLMRKYDKERGAETIFLMNM
jgi:hypothetical protein